ncbi:hypothetical protein ACF09Y_34150 [Streptomyces massasporeus]|uniref:hypothetical protein n=1 Tax=Streptomyces massasporeus TaxID=67324 RepID=UPI0036F91120
MTTTPIAAIAIAILTVISLPPGPVEVTALPAIRQAAAHLGMPPGSCQLTSTPELAAVPGSPPGLPGSPFWLCHCPGMSFRGGFGSRWHRFPVISASES